MIVIHAVLWVYFASRSSFPNATTSWTHFYINKDCLAIGPRGPVVKEPRLRKCVNKEGSICSATKYGADAVKINPTDGFIIGSPEKTAEGDAAEMLDGSAVEPALPPIEPVSGGSQQLRMDH
ncbi:hypothetical protein Bca4012_097634 [Brassica carinata]|uniref:(rape) hypothetical protein n=1 Tax=Brassica napus TaxID=3708 RepID=A0A816PU30_BRANA|nr:unnamed protein product [Brassica napus]